MGFPLPVLQSLPGSLRAAYASPRSVRISVTDRCDMACLYCRPHRHDGYLPAEDRLELSHWEDLLKTLVSQGIRRVRITGGEPLLHPSVLALVSLIRSLGVDDLALTTNASRLARLARPLRDAGLQRINISLDSLRPDRFAAITRGGDLDEVLAGVHAALSVGFDEVKTNTVVLRDANDDELQDITRWAWSLGVIPRFIEVMGVGEGANLWRERLVPAAEMRQRLGGLLEDSTGDPTPDRGPAKYVFAADGSGRCVGFITGSSDTYCEGCDRLRATSDGVLRPCLATNDGVDVSDDLRAGAAPDVLARRLHDAWAMKPDARWKGCTEHTAQRVSMRATGG